MKIIVISDDINRDHPFGQLRHVIYEGIPQDLAKKVPIGNYVLNPESGYWYKRSVIGGVVVVHSNTVPAEIRAYALLLV
jgi:hypothetical protein